MEKPRLRRDIQLMPALYQGRRIIAFQDPLKLAGGDIALDAGLSPLLTRLDGTHDRRELQAALPPLDSGESISMDDLDALLERLDEIFLLDSERYRGGKRSLQEAFRSDPDRHPAFAGAAYSADADELRAFIGDLEQNLAPFDNSSTHDAVTGVLAPHIDTNVAGRVYVDLYRRLRGRRYDRVVILGINHQEQDGLYSVLNKGFQTPLGRFAPDEDFIAALSDGLPPGVIATDDFGHKMEHSIEFQTIFLGHYLEPSFRVVPILCGSLYQIMEGEGTLLENDRFRAMYERLDALIRNSSGSTLVVSAVDFAHLGLKFGHPSPASSMLEKALENDRELLSFIKDGAAEEIYRYARNREDCFNVCGLPSMVLFALLMRDSRGHLLAHETYNEEATESAVTYASMLFEATSVDGSSERPRSDGGNG